VILKCGKIFLSPTDSISSKQLRAFKSEIDKFEKLIEEKDAKEINQFIKNAKNFRDSLT
jgi:prephenate dehydrogenase